MNNFFIMILTSLFLLMLNGCTIATPVVTNGAYEGLNNTNPKKGTLYVYRKKAFAGSVNQYDVMLNDALVGSLPNGSFFSIDVDSGDNKVEPRTLTSFGFGKGSIITVEEGKSYCLKLTLNFCVQCKSANIDVVDIAQCDSEIKSLKRVQLK